MCVYIPLHSIVSMVTVKASNYTTFVFAPVHAPSFFSKLEKTS